MSDNTTSATTVPAPTAAPEESDAKLVRVFCKAFQNLMLRFADGSNIIIKGMSNAEAGKDHAVTEDVREDKISAWLAAHADSDLVRNGHIGIHTGNPDDMTVTAEPVPEPAAATIPAPSTSDASTGGANSIQPEAQTQPASDSVPGGYAGTFAGKKKGDDDKSASASKTSSIAPATTSSSTTTETADQQKVDELADKIEASLAAAKQQQS